MHGLVLTALPPLHRQLQKHGLGVQRTGLGACSLSKHVCSSYPAPTAHLQQRLEQHGDGKAHALLGPWVAARLGPRKPRQVCGAEWQWHAGELAYQPWSTARVQPAANSVCSQKNHWRWHTGLTCHNGDQQLSQRLHPQLWRQVQLLAGAQRAAAQREAVQVGSRW